MDQRDRVIAEERVGAAGELDVMGDVGAGLLQVHPVDRAAQRDPLIQRREHALAQLATQRRLAEQQTRERRARVHLGVRQHPQLFELLDRQHVRLIQDENHGLAALGGLRGEQLGRLRDQRRPVEPWGRAERRDDLSVDPARPDRRVGQVDDRVPARVQAGGRRSRGDGLAGADLAAHHPERPLGDDPVDPRDSLLVGSGREQH